MIYILEQFTFTSYKVQDCTLKILFIPYDFTVMSTYGHKIKYNFIDDS